MPEKPPRKPKNSKHRFDVFLCHNGQDKLAVKRIDEELRTIGLQTWLDERELRPGLSWQKAIEEQIPEMGSAAVFVGPDGLGPWQDMEINAFLRELVHRDCPVIPVILEGAEQEPPLPIFLKGNTWVDFRKTDPVPLDHLVFGITGEWPQPQHGPEPSDPTLRGREVKTQTFGGVRRRRDSVSLRLDAGITDGDRRYPPSEDEALHRAIDNAASYFQKEEPEVALVLLDQIEKQFGDRLTERLRFRVLANKGHAFRLKEDFPSAARLYLAAHHHQPQDEQARCLAALAYWYLQDLEHLRPFLHDLRKEFPHSILATAISINAAPDDVSYAELLTSIPEDLRNRHNIAHALAHRAALARDDGAAEAHARAALRDCPDWPEAQECLGASIVQQAIESVVAGAGPVTDPAGRGRLEEAVALVSAAIGKLRTRAVPAHLASLLLSRAMAFELLGAGLKARVDVVAAYHEAPDYPEAATAYADHLREQGHTDEAVSILRELTSRTPWPQASFMLAHILRNRGQKRDLSEAAKLLSAPLPGMRSEPRRVLEAWVDALVDVHLALGDANAAASLLHALPAEALSREASLGLRASVAFASGDGVAALRLADEAIRAISGTTERSDIRRVAELLSGAAQHRRAFPLWKRIVTPTSISPNTYRYLQSAYECGERADIISFCQALRRNGIVDRKCVDLELASLAEESPQRAMDCCKETLASGQLEESLAKFVRLRLSHLGILMRQSDLIEVDPHALPGVPEVTPEVGRAVVEALRHGAGPLSAVKYAYELLRRFPDAEDSHLALIAAFGMGTTRDIKLDQPEAVQPGTAVYFKEDDTGEAGWRILEDLPEPSISRNELGPDHDLWQELLGKRVGEHFLLRKADFQNRTGTVTEIVAKYVQSWRDCMYGWETRFPGNPAVVRVVLPKELRSPLDFEPLLRAMDPHAERSAEVERVYRDKSLTLAAFAHGIGTSVFDLVVDRVAWRQDLPLKCCLANTEEINQAVSCLTGAKGVVVDSTALATLFLIRRANVLRLLPVKPMIAEHTLYELRASGLIEAPDRERSSLARNGSEAVRLVLPIEAVRERRDRMREFLNYVESSCTVAPGACHEALDGAPSDLILQVLGRSGADSVGLAKQNGYALWSDDLAVAGLAVAHHGIRRTWTQAVFFRLVEDGKVAASELPVVAEALLGVNCEFTMLRPVDFVAISARNGWRCDGPILQRALARFSNANSDRTRVYSLAAAVLKQLWQSKVLDIHAEALTKSILDRIGSRESGVQLVSRILRDIDRLFPFDSANARSVERTVRLWLAAHGA